MELFLINFLPKNNKSENHKLQKEYTKFFVDYILKNHYNCKDCLKNHENGKPYLEKSSFDISISHSHSLIALLFAKEQCGVDVELIKNRNYQKILDYYNIENDFTEEQFYQWWTSYEAEYKSGIKAEIHSFKYKNFICSISSESKKPNNVFEINYENNQNIVTKDYTIEEFYLPLNIKNTAKTINTNPTR